MVHCTQIARRCSFLTHLAQYRNRGIIKTHFQILFYVIRESFIQLLQLCKSIGLITQFRQYYNFYFQPVTVQPCLFELAILFTTEHIISRNITSCTICCLRYNSPPVSYFAKASSTTPSSLNHMYLQLTKIQDRQIKLISKTFKYMSTIIAIVHL